MRLKKSIFIIYCFILAWLVLFKFSFSLADIQGLKMIRSVNLIPFHYGTDVGRLHAKEVIMNAIVFVPFGVYLRMFDASWKKTIMYGFSCSLMFEVCQFVFAIGASDITDVLTNTFGTVVGIVLYVVARRIFSNKEKLDKLINRIAIVLLTLFCVLFLLLFIANY